MLTVDPTRTSHVRGQVIEYVAAAAAFLALAVPVVLELHVPPTMAVTFVNPHEWDIGVEVVFADGDQLGVATIDGDSQREISELLRLESP